MPELTEDAKKLIEATEWPGRIEDVTADALITHGARLALAWEAETRPLSRRVFKMAKDDPDRPEAMRRYLDATTAMIAEAQVTAALVAVQEVSREQANEWKDGESLFLRASVWREFAEHVAGSLTKGSRVVATGRLKQRSYQDKDGATKTSIELEVDEIGPSLRYATAVVTRAGSTGGRSNATASDGSWATPGAADTTGWASPGEETPF